MPETQVDLDARIDELFARSDWWRLPPELNAELEDLLTELYIEGLNIEAARIEALRLGLDEPPFIALAWDLQDERVRRLIDTHAAEMVRNVNNGTKYYLRQLIKEGVAEGLGTTEMVQRIQRDLFGLPAAEAGKFPRERLQSIVNYEVNKVSVPLRALWSLWQDERGNHILQVASVPQWGGNAEMHTRTINNVMAGLAESGIRAKRNTSYIDPLTMDASNYDDYIIQG